MPATAVIDSIECHLEKLADGRIKVSYASPAVNAMQGANTGGTVMYLVHPCQRNQYHSLNVKLPPEEQATPANVDLEARPWWSLSAGERASLRE